MNGLLIGKIRDLLLPGLWPPFDEKFPSSRDVEADLIPTPERILLYVRVGHRSFTRTLLTPEMLAQGAQKTAFSPGTAAPYKALFKPRLVELLAEAHELLMDIPNETRPH